MLALLGAIEVVRAAYTAPLLSNLHYITHFNITNKIIVILVISKYVATTSGSL